MTVLEFMRSYNAFFGKKDRMLIVKNVPGDGTSKTVHNDVMGNELHMRPEVREAKIRIWGIDKKSGDFIVIV